MPQKKLPGDNQMKDIKRGALYLQKKYPLTSSVLKNAIAIDPSAFPSWKQIPPILSLSFQSIQLMNIS